MSFTDKRLSEVTSEDIRRYARPLSLQGLPYPTVDYPLTGPNGTPEMTLEVSGITGLPPVIYTELSQDEVSGSFIRNQPIPSLLKMQEEVLARFDPRAKDRLYASFGDAGLGKTHLIEHVARMMHPKGAVRINCSGRNMNEVFFRTVIDYGVGVKEDFEKKLAAGAVPRKAIEAMKETFGEAVTDVDGKISLDWDKISANKKTVEVLEAVYALSGVSAKVGAFGIKTELGEAALAIMEGRPIIFDEFNKCDIETLVGWEDLLQAMKGERAEARIPNLLATSESDAVREFVVRASDFRVGSAFFFIGNEAKDGQTTKPLPVSITTRLNPQPVGNPQKIDWKQRVSQIWLEGLPLTTIHELHKDWAAKDPEAFFLTMLELQRYGRKSEDKYEMQSLTLALLKNIPDTVKGIEKVSDFYEFCAQLADTTSMLYADPKYGDLASEVNGPEASKRIMTSFRTIISDFAAAMLPMVHGQAPAPGDAIDINAFRKAAESFDISQFPQPWERFGAQIAQVIYNRIIANTKDMPNVRMAMIDKAKELGILPQLFHESVANPDHQYITDLLKFDPLAGLGGTDELRQTRDLVLSALRARHPDIDNNDDRIMPIERLAHRMKGVAAPKGRDVLIPNTDVNTLDKSPLVEATVEPYYEKAPHDLLELDLALAALATPDHGRQTLARTWFESDLHDMARAAVQAQDGATAEDPQHVETRNTMMGKGKLKMSFNYFAAANTKGERTTVAVIYDEVTERGVLVGTENISSALSGALEKNRLTYLHRSAPETAEKVNNFLQRGVEEREKRKDDGASGSSVTFMENLGNTLLMFAEKQPSPEALVRIENGEQIIRSGVTVGAMVTGVPTPQRIFTRFVKKRAV